MKKNLLKLITGIFFVALSFNANAQFDIGGGLIFNSEAAPDLGLNARVQFGVAEILVIAPAINYYFKTLGLNVLEVNGDVHYPFAVGESINVYPLGGLSLSRFSGFGNSNSRLGLNLGGGVNFGITDSLKGFGELKTILVFDGDGYSPIVLSAGVLFSLGG
jgi:hypothetical protein